MTNMVKGHLQASHITALRGTEGKITMEPKQINLTLQEFYKIFICRLK